MSTPTLLVASAGRLAELGPAFEDLGEPYTMRVRTVEVAPAGAGGQAAFPRCYVVVTFDVPCSFRVTPILNGVPIWDESVDIEVEEAPADGQPQTHVWEIGWEIPRMRGDRQVGSHFPIGTWFQVEVSMPCPAGDYGNLLIETPIEIEVEAL